MSDAFKLLSNEEKFTDELYAFITDPDADNRNDIVYFLSIIKGVHILDMRTLYNRRNALKLGLGSLSSLSLASLAGCDTPLPSIPSQTSAALRMFFWGSATRDKLTRQTINLYQQSHPHVTISSQYSGNDTYYTKLDAQIAAGKAPDLIQMDMRYIAQYVRRGMLLDLTQYIYNQNIDLSDFDPILLDSSKVNNTIYGIPLGSNYQCFFCSTALLEKAAIGPLPTNATWDMFAEYTAELSKALGNGIYGTSDASGNYDTFEIWIRQRGKELYTKEGALDFEQADVADWYNYWSKVRQNKACPPMSIQTKLDLTGSPTDSSVIKGKAVFSHLFSNQLEAFQAAFPTPLALVAYPQGNTPGLFLKASQLLSIFSGTPYPNQATNFTSFAIKNPGAVKTLGFERGVPGSVASLAILKPKLTTTQQTIVEFMNQIAASGLTRVKEVLDPPGAGQISTILQKVAQDIGSGKTSVPAGAAEFYLNAKKVAS